MATAKEEAESMSKAAKKSGKKIIKCNSKNQQFEGVIR